MIARPRVEDESERRLDRSAERVEVRQPRVEHRLRERVVARVAGIVGRAGRPHEHRRETVRVVTGACDQRSTWSARRLLFRAPRTEADDHVARAARRRAREPAQRERVAQAKRRTSARSRTPDPLLARHVAALRMPNGASSASIRAIS